MFFSDSAQFGPLNSENGRRAASSGNAALNERCASLYPTFLFFFFVCRLYQLII